MPPSRQLIAALANHAAPAKFTATRNAAEQAGLIEVGRPAFERECAAFVASYYRRLIALTTARSRKRVLGGVHSEGTQHLEQVLATNRGAILASVHLGDFDLAGAWLAAAYGITPVVVAERLDPLREALVSGIRRRAGVVVRDPRHTGLSELQRDLELGRFVLVMLDRRPAGQTVACRLLDQPAVASAGVAALLAKSGTPLLPAATFRTRDGQLVTWFGEPQITSSFPAAVAALDCACEDLSVLIRRFAEQWHVPADHKQLAFGLPSHPENSGNARENSRRLRPRRHHGAPAQRA